MRGYVCGHCKAEFADLAQACEHVYTHPRKGSLEERLERRNRKVARASKYAAQAYVGA